MCECVCAFVCAFGHACVCLCSRVCACVCLSISLCVVYSQTATKWIETSCINDDNIYMAQACTQGGLEGV